MIPKHVYYYDEEGDVVEKRKPRLAHGDTPYEQICNLLIADSNHQSKDEEFPTEPIGLCGIQKHDFGHVAVCFRLVGQAYSRSHNLFVLSDRDLDNDFISGLCPDGGEDEDGE